MKKLKSLYYQCRVQGIDYRLKCYKIKAINGNIAFCMLWSAKGFAGVWLKRYIIRKGKI